MITNIEALFLFLSLCFFFAFLYKQYWQERCIFRTGFGKRKPFRRDSNLDLWKAILKVNYQIIGLVEEIEYGKYCVFILNNLYRIEDQILYNPYPNKAKIKIWYQEIKLFIQDETVLYAISVEFMHLSWEYEELMGRIGNKSVEFVMK